MFILNDETHPDILFPTHHRTGLDLSQRDPQAKFAYGATAPAVGESLLIPVSEWRARIEEMKERKSMLSDFIKASGVKVKNQKNTNFCHSEKTEVLTSRGWVRWPDYNWVDSLGTVNPVSGFLEFQQPLQKHIYEHRGHLIHSTHRGCLFSVTPDHRMAVRKWNEKERSLDANFQFVTAENLGWYFGLPPHPKGWVGAEFVEIEIPDDRRYDGDDFLALIALVCSDGYAGKEHSEKSSGYVSFCCFHPSRYDMVAALAARVGFKEVPSKKGVWTRYSAHGLAKWIRAHCYQGAISAEFKRIPRFVMESSSRQISHFLQFFGDKSHAGHESFCSTSKGMLDDIQELLLRCSRRSSMWKPQMYKPSIIEETGQVVTPRNPVYSLGVNSSSELSVQRRQNIETDSYSGAVYCATVLNGTLITRLNGTVLISGNCWANAPCTALEIVRAQQGQKYVELSPASVACKINGFKNEGGWGKHALEYLIQHGAVPASMWPSNAIDRRFDTTANEIVAKKYRGVEWNELPVRDLGWLGSMLLRRIPVAVGYNWWGHEITAVDIDWLDGEFVLRILNSWGSDWGDGGFAVLQGRKMLPDDAVAPRTAIAA